ncbi:unnamed protein product [Paramecium octaurelia]|uniref:Uncharacterized protein n=1 Tax=Paramecium octaurelia TaxID=43137 RepID=A0A8S1W5M7_PAROT|nr:unnamed protein product [Paramecium octaurelia]
MMIAQKHHNQEDPNTKRVLKLSTIKVHPLPDGPNFSVLEKLKKIV